MSYASRLVRELRAHGYTDVDELQVFAFREQAEQLLRGCALDRKAQALRETWRKEHPVHRAIHVEVTSPIEGEE